MKLPKGSVTVGDRHVGDGFPTYIIAEIGTNHGASLERAKELISACAKAGADAVKFQSWETSKFQNSKDVTPDGSLSDSCARPILEKYELPEDWHWRLAEQCQREGVHFLSTPFDVARARLLRSLNVPAIKIASGDLTYDELLLEVASYQVPVFLSTGMADMVEIRRALDRLNQNAHPDLVLLHCVAAYPPDLKDANLLAIRTLKETFQIPVGISDHLTRKDMSVAAVALGACVIEKHVTFSRLDPTPDSFFALEMDEFQQMIQSVRDLELALGDGEKRCMPSETEGRINGRRSLYATRDLEVGQLLAREDVAIVRPNIGELQPQDLSRVLGRRVRVAVPSGTPLRWEHLANT
jgi:N,N'-diacetyllegionaminate synthase